MQQNLAAEIIKCTLWYIFQYTVEYHIWEKVQEFRHVIYLLIIINISYVLYEHVHLKNYIYLCTAVFVALRFMNSYRFYW